MAAVLCENLPDGPEAHAVAMKALGCDTELEELRHYLGGNAAPFVRHNHLNCLGVSVQTHSDLCASSGNRLASISGDIEEDLPGLSREALNDAVPIHFNVEVNLLIAD